MLDAPVLGLSVAAGSGLGLAVYAFARWYLKVPESRLISSRDGGHKRAQRVEDLPLAVQRFLMEKTEETGGLPPWLGRWIALAAERLSRAGIGVPAGRYIAGTVLAALAGMAVGVRWLNNLPAAIVLAAAAFMIPDAFLVGRIQKRRRRMIDQMGAAVRLFAAEFADTPQVLRALSRTAANVPAPLGTVLQRAASSLTAGQNRDEVCARLMQDLDFDYGRMFVVLLRIGWDDAAVRPLFSRLAARIGGLQALIRTNHRETAQARALALGVNILTLPMFFFVRAAVPGAAEFLVGHPVGRFIVFLSFLSVLMGLLVDRAVSEVDM